ncbi:MAG: metal-sulfur cluster assembly factor [Pannonibacter sp.]
MTSRVENLIFRALELVEDPELGVSIVDLGLVRQIEVTPEQVHVTIAMTTPTCPLGGLIAETARASVELALAPGTAVKVTLDRSFHWTPDLATPQVRDRFTGSTSVSLADRLRMAVSGLLGSQ